MKKDKPLTKTKHYEVGDPPMVSVCMIAYNVGKFLPAAIDSFLAQKTDFTTELVIGEDCSADDTRKIALDYRDKYPDLIKVLFPKENQGLTPNSVATQNACTGKYIAFLDSDDYWTDNHKLQKQVDFLEKNPDFSGYGHQSTVIYDDNSKADHNFGSTEEAVLSIKDTISHRRFHTSSLIYRRELWVKTGGIPTSILSNERAVYPMIAIFGKIFYDPAPMCVYRKSSIGISSRITSYELEKDLNMIPWLKKIDRSFPYFRFKSFLHFCTYTYPAKVSFGQLMKHTFMFSLLSFSYFPKSLGDLKFGLMEFFRIFKRDVLNSQ